MDPEKDFDMDDLAIMFVYFLEGKMDEVLGFTVEDLNQYDAVSNYPEVGEGDSPAYGMLYKGGTITMIPAKSNELHARGFEPFPDTHLSTQHALTLTQALATLHATLRSKGVTKLNQVHSSDSNEPCTLIENIKDISLVMEESSQKDKWVKETPCLAQKDDWTSQISRPELVAANLSILGAHFKQVGVSLRIVNKLQSLNNDIDTLTQFLQFAAMMQSASRLQSFGPVNMCDIWIPSSQYNTESSGEESLVIRLRGGSELQAPPLRDTAWMWLTLLRPDVLRDRYMELCEVYCSTFNNTLEKTGNSDKSMEQIEEMTLFDIMRDLGESFLHGFLTIVHKSTVSGIWSIDRNLDTTEGIECLAESIGFLVDNGIIGSLFVA